MAISGYPNKGMEPRVEAGARYWLTDNGELVEDGDPRARYLYCHPHHRVPKAEFEALKKGMEEKPAQPTKAEPAPPPEAVETAAEESADDYEDMSYRDLQKACKAAGVSAAGSTEDLIERLRES